METLAEMLASSVRHFGERPYDFCREHLSAYKAPRAVYTVEEMPLGPTGKILKRKLRDWGIADSLKQVA